MRHSPRSLMPRPKFTIKPRRGADDDVAALPPPPKPKFSPAASYGGARPGYVFMTGSKGLGGCAEGTEAPPRPSSAAASPPSSGGSSRPLHCVEMGPVRKVIRRNIGDLTTPSSSWPRRRRGSVAAPKTPHAKQTQPASTGTFAMAWGRGRRLPNTGPLPRGHGTRALPASTPAPLERGRRRVRAGRGGGRKRAAPRPTMV